MEYTKLGATGILVSRLGLGLAALGRPGYITLGHGTDLAGLANADDWEKHTHDMLNVAWNNGISYFDTARSYGRGEKFLGDWFRENKIPEAKATAGSKWGYTYTADWQVHAEQHEVKNHSLPQLEKQREESNLLLGAYLKVYHIHSATLDSGVLDNALVLERLHTLKNTGLHIGLSVSGANQAEAIEKALTICYDGVCLFDVVQVTYNILEQSAEQALIKASKKGLGIIIKEAMANGRLSLRNSNLENTDLVKNLKHLATNYNTTPDAIAISFVLSKPWAHVVLSGAVTKEQLLQNLESFSVNLSSSDYNLLKPFAEDNEHYWGNRKKLLWN